MTLRQERQRLFMQVDVFTGVPYRGNPLAVVLDGTGVTDEAMQHFARWTNLSETTFLLPPTSDQADYRVRIMTPGGELPFAGHPTLGSCHAWLQAGGKPRTRNVVVQECAKGLVTIRRETDGLAFAAPSLKCTAPSPAVLAQVASALGLKASQVVASQILDNGPAWFSLLLDTPQTVLGIKPNDLELKRLGLKVGVAARYEGKSEADLEVRAFAAANGIPEDPVTGSLNAGLAEWLIGEGRMPARYVASQGACLERAGRVTIERDDEGRVWVGGQSVTCVTGTVLL